MRYFGFRFQATRFASIQLALAGMVSVLLPIAPANATQRYSEYRAQEVDYQACARGLVDTGITAEDAAIVCSAALAPSDLSDCVIQIKAETAIVATDALTGCRQTRRPIELAACVVNINANTQNAVALNVLDNCRRSLLPVRFSNCVVGVSLETALPPELAMSNCIAAGDRPRNVLPSFVPSSEPIPTTPRALGDLSPTGGSPDEKPSTGSPDQPLRLTPLVPVR
jgi:hypothetical protein